MEVKTIIFKKKQRLLIKCHVYFLLPMYDTENIALNRISEMEISKDLHDLRSPESKNPIYIGWYVCVYICYQRN